MFAAFATVLHTIGIALIAFAGLYAIGIILLTAAEYRDRAIAALLFQPMPLPDRQPTETRP